MGLNIERTGDLQHRLEVEATGSAVELSGIKTKEQYNGGAKRRRGSYKDKFEIVRQINPDGTFSYVTVEKRQSGASDAGSMGGAEQVIREIDLREAGREMDIAVYERGEKQVAVKEFVGKIKPDWSCQVQTRRRPQTLHGAISETRPGGEVVVSQDELPWLRESTRVKLVEVELVSGETLRLGSVIKDANGIEQAARELSKESSGRINGMLYQGLAEKRVAEKIRKQRSRTPVLYFGNENGERVYFVKLPNLTGDVKSAGMQEREKTPTILLVAACHKSHQTAVLRSLTTVKNIKNKGN